MWLCHINNLLAKFPCFPVSCFLFFTVKLISLAQKFSLRAYCIFSVSLLVYFVPYEPITEALTIIRLKWKLLTTFTLFFFWKNLCFSYSFSFSYFSQLYNFNFKIKLTNFRININHLVTSVWKKYMKIRCQF